MGKDKLEWRPHKGAQEAFHSCPAFEVLLGGAAGGGKSESLLVEATRYIKHSDYTALLMRRKYTELAKADGLIDRSFRIYPGLGGVWNAEKRRWTFPSGAVIEFGHCELERNKYDYQSANYSYIGIDELTHFTESIYLFMISRVRSVNPDVPKRIRAATNPGNIGHVWVKKRFIDKREPYTIYRDANGNTRAFIPATAYDNPTLMKNDPDYVKRLELLPDREKRMYLYGDWDVFEGMYFDEWNEEIHVVKPFELGNVFRFIGIDYGYSAPSAVGWFAVTEDGHIYMYRELYEERLLYSELAEKILEMTPKREKIAYAVADPAIWGDRPHQRDAVRGENGAEVMSKVFGERITLMKGDNNRVPGWLRFRQYLHPVDGDAKFKVFSNCRNAIRTIPQMVFDERNPEDLDTTGEDHACDAIRYGLMSRPYIPEIEKPKRILTRDELLWKRAKEQIKRIRSGKKRMQFIGTDY